MLGRFPALQRLDLSACRRAQDWELRGLAGLRELAELRMDGLDALTDAGVALLAPLAGQLSALSLRNCSKVRDSFAGETCRSWGREVEMPPWQCRPITAQATGRQGSPVPDRNGCSASIARDTVANSSHGKAGVLAVAGLATRGFSMMGTSLRHARHVRARSSCGRCQTRA